MERKRYGIWVKATKAFHEVEGKILKFVWAADAELVRHRAGLGHEDAKGHKEAYVCWLPEVGMVM